MTQNDQQDPSDDSRPNVAKRFSTAVAILLQGLMAIIVILGLISLSTEAPDSEPDWVGSYSEAVQEKEASIVNDAGRSLLMTHGDTTDKVFAL